MQIKLRIARNLSSQTATKASFVNRGLLRDPVIADNFRKTVLKHLGDTPVSQGDIPVSQGIKYPALRDAVHASEQEVVSSSARLRPGWFNASQQQLLADIAASNKAQLV